MYQRLLERLLKHGDSRRLVPIMCDVTPLTFHPGRGRGGKRLQRLHEELRKLLEGSLPAEQRSPTASVCHPETSQPPIRHGPRKGART